MTKVFCDLCEKERTVCKHEILTRMSIGGYPNFQICDVCDECYKKILNAGLEEFQKIRREALMNEADT